MPYLRLSVPSGTQIGDTVDAAFDKTVVRVTLLNDDWLRIAETSAEEEGIVCRIILVATSEDGRTILCVHQPARPND